MAHVALGFPSRGGLAPAIPDRGEGAAAVQPLGRALLVDVADQAAVDAVAHQRLEPWGKGPRQFRRHAQLLVLLLADEAGAVVHGDAGSPLAGAVGPAAMPER